MVKNRRISKSIKKFKEKTCYLKERIKILTADNKELQFQMQLQLTESERNVASIKRELDEKNRLTWPLIMIKVIIEMLTNGAPPSAVCKNIEIVMRMLCPNVACIELPNINYVRRCRGIIRIVTETLSACEAGLDIEWTQTFKDETQRKTAPLTTFSALVRRNRVLKPLVLSCSEIGIGSTSEDTVDSIKRMLSNGREYLGR